MTGFSSLTKFLYLMFNLAWFWVMSHPDVPSLVCELLFVACPYLLLGWSLLWTMSPGHNEADTKTSLF